MAAGGAYKTVSSNNINYHIILEMGCKHFFHELTPTNEKIKVGKLPSSGENIFAIGYATNIS